MSTIAVIGLGAMGKAMADNLVQAGHQVSVWNRSPAPVAELAAVGARPLISWHRPSTPVWFSRYWPMTTR